MTQELKHLQRFNNSTFLICKQLDWRGKRVGLDKEVISPHSPVSVIMAD